MIITVSLPHWLLTLRDRSGAKRQPVLYGELQGKVTHIVLPYGQSRERAS